MLPLKLNVLLNLVSLSSAGLLPFYQGFSTRTSLAKCVGEATKLFFNDADNSLVSLSTSNHTESVIATDTLLFSELFAGSNMSLIIKKPSTVKKSEFYYKKIDNYIIQIKDATEIYKSLQILKKYPTWNSHARFLVVSAAVFYQPKIIAASVIEQLWLENVVNGVVILPDPGNVTSFIAYSWFPFTEGHCTNGNTEILIVDRCNFGRFFSGKNWYPNKVPRNLHGCLFKVRAVVWPPYVLPPKNGMGLTFTDGLEVRLLNTMAEVANFSISYSVSEKVQDWGNIDKDGTATGAHLVLKNREADIAIGSFAATVMRNYYFDYVTYNIPESLTWCVPHAKNQKKWKKLLLVIPAELWFFTISIFLVVSICMWGLSNFENNDSSSYKIFSSCIQNTFSIFVNMAVKVQPKSFPVRILFIIWVFFSLHFSALYQTSLISILTKPKYEQQVTTIYDIFENDLEMWFISNTKQYFLDKSDWVSIQIRKEWNDCEDIEKCLNATAFNRTTAVCIPRTYINYAVTHYVTRKGKPLLYCFKDSLVTFPLEMLLSRGFPLTYYFEVLIGRITAAGLIAQWERQIFDKQFRHLAYTTSSQDEFILNFSYLKLLFILLLIGNFSAFIVFILELFVYYKFHCKLY